MSEENVREHRRVHVVWRAVFRPKDSKVICRGKTTDVSYGGLAAYFESQLMAGQQGTLFLEMATPGRPRICIEIESVVVYSTLVGHINAFRTGVKFKGSNAEYDTILRKLM